MMRRLRQSGSRGHHICIVYQAYHSVLKPQHYSTITRHPPSKESEGQLPPRATDSRKSRHPPTELLPASTYAQLTMITAEKERNEGSNERRGRDQPRPGKSSTVQQTVRNTIISSLAQSSRSLKPLHPLLHPGHPPALNFRPDIFHQLRARAPHVPAYKKRSQRSTGKSVRDGRDIREERYVKTTHTSLCSTDFSPE